MTHINIILTLISCFLLHAKYKIFPSCLSERAAEISPLPTLTELEIFTECPDSLTFRLQLTVPLLSQGLCHYPNI
jgi:hypothetical protein